MIRRFDAARRAMALMACALGAVLAAPAGADKGDREKPINFSADQPAEVDFEKRVGTLRGNVVITQGTTTIRADRIEFKQNADNSLSATAFGNPVSFRQKKDDSDEYFEGFAQRAVYDGQKQLLELFDRALLKQGSDEIPPAGQPDQAEAREQLECRDQRIDSPVEVLFLAEHDRCGPHGRHDRHAQVPPRVSFSAAWSQRPSTRLTDW